MAFSQVRAHEAEAEVTVVHPHLPLLEDAYASSKVWSDDGVYCNRKKIPKAEIEDLLSGINPSFKTETCYDCELERQTLDGLIFHTLTEPCRLL